MLSRITFVLLSALLILVPGLAVAASLSIDPATSSYGPGDTFIATVRIDNEQDCINAVNVELSYSKDTLRAVDFSTGESIFSLWAVEPKIDTNTGTILFAGGIPGGYCGRITGDAALSNVLGKIVFSVISSTSPEASITFLPASAVYLNDGLGTLAKLTTTHATVKILSTSTSTQNPWLAQVAQDTTPPQPFTVDVESTNGVFGGRYYIVFSTTDKESGLDHFEIAQRGSWKRITSPYLLENQSLFGVGDIQVRALDKAGNIRLGLFSASSTPQRQFSTADFALPLLLLIIILLILGAKMSFQNRKASENTPTS